MAKAPLPGWDGILDAGEEILWQGSPFLLGWFWTEAKRQRNAYYTRTTRAAHIGVEDKGTRSLEQYEIGLQNPISLEEGAWGQSGLRVSHITARGLWRGYLRGGATTSQMRVGFERLANARKVYAMMRKVQIARAEAEGKKDA